MIKGCRPIENYKILNKIEEGTYGIVYRAIDRATGETVALKKLKWPKDERDGFPVTSLREINALMRINHPHVVALKEVAMGVANDEVYLVMEYVEHDLRTLIDDECDKKRFSISEIKTLMKQLLSAISEMHKRWMIHRDLKTSNLLLSNKGEIKVADFGLARRLGDPPMVGSHLTPLVVTLWYRAPELLLGDPAYDFSVDCWSLGCIMAELLLWRPLFPGKTEIAQLDNIFALLGLPDDTRWPGWGRLPHARKIKPNPGAYIDKLDQTFRDVISEAGKELLRALLTFDPKKRITAAEALRHPWFEEEPRPKDPSLFPTWPVRN